MVDNTAGFKALPCLPMWPQLQCRWNGLPHPTDLKRAPVICLADTYKQRTYTHLCSVDLASLQTATASSSLHHPSPYMMGTWNSPGGGGRGEWRSKCYLLQTTEVWELLCSMSIAIADDKWIITEILGCHPCFWFLFYVYWVEMKVSL